MKRSPVRLGDYFIQRFQSNADFKSEALNMCGDPLLLCYLDSLVDTAASARIRQMIPEITAPAESWKPIDAEVDLDDAALEKAILTGRFVILHRTGNFALHPVTRKIQRSIDTPQSETPIQGASDAFTESLFNNIGLIRLHLRSLQLSIQDMEMGTVSKRTLAVCHVKGSSSDQIANRILSHLTAQKNRDIGNIQDLARVLGQRSWSPVPLFFTSEVPEEAVTLLLKGRVLILLDQLPYALIAPPLITDLWTVYSDKNLPKSLMLSIQWLRILGIFISLIIPGLYVALVSVNPELFRIEMALSVARSREGVPYPAVIEMLLMLAVIEMIVAASVRLPKTVGPTITMVGGIILGQAAVQAQLVSNLLLIVLSATVIANYTFVGIQNALMIRLLKYGNVLLGSIFGVLGILAGLVWLLFYLASIHTFDVPYLSLTLKSEEEHG